MWKRRNGKNGETTARKTVGYVRVSTESQARDGVSLEAQEARLRAFCEATGRRLDAVIVDDGVSAKTMKRAGLRAILDGVKADEIGCVITLKLDRITRSVRDLYELTDFFAKFGVDFVSVSESIDTRTAVGKAQIGMLGIMAQLEREQTAERTAFALAHKRRSGKVYGHAPFGYQRNGNELVPVQKELDALSEARRMFEAGLSYRKIAAMFEACGIQPRGKAWYPASVRAVLNSKAAQAHSD